MAINEENDCGCGSSEASVGLLQQQQPACTQNVTAEVCAQANVSITPQVTAGTPIVSCLHGPLINTPCSELEGFTPIDQTGSCTFSVSQIICVTIPLDFSAEVIAEPAGGACGPVTPGTVCPPLPTPAP